MAKRKRLEMPQTAPNSPVLETKSAFPPAPRARMPIADVAGETAGRAALEEVAREMTAAQEDGRMIQRLPLSAIRTHHLARDRMVFDRDEMEALVASIAARGQQTPIEVLALHDGTYGLISGLRRIEALRRIESETVLAIIRKPDTAQAAYVAMVEENEIRADLSFFERAHIAAAAVEQGVYRRPADAVKALFAHATPAKRSKITKFGIIVEKLGAALSFPAAIPEHLGLKLAQALEDDPRLGARLTDALRKTPPVDPQAERRTLERALKRGAAKVAPAGDEIAPGVRLETRKGRAVFTGPGVDAEFLEAVRSWAVSHAKTTPSGGH